MMNQTSTYKKEHWQNKETHYGYFQYICGFQRSRWKEHQGILWRNWTGFLTSVHCPASFEEWEEWTCHRGICQTTWKKVRMSYKKVNILELANMLSEDCLKELLCSFACPLNSDIENFIRFKCLSFARQKLSVSHLVFDEMENLLGFFTLANKPCLIRNDTVTSELSNTLKKKLDRFTACLLTYCANL